MATKYYVSYDLNRDKDYQKITAELERYNAIRVLESLWCLPKENTSAKELRDHFKKYIDKDDQLIVIKSAGSAWTSVINNPTDLD